ncbi:MAG: ribonuclease Y [Candidatus Eisenbacteria sp.]|nr:ribonuclease Y [Candidatus Eisenbacteria bacterium]
MSGLLLTILIAIVSAGGFLCLGWYAHRRVGENNLLSTAKQAEKLIAEAKKEADTYGREATLQAKNEWYRAKENFDKETKEKREDLQTLEKTFAERDANLNRRVDILDKKENSLASRDDELEKQERSVEEKKQDLEQLLVEQNSKLERIAGLTQEEAKRMLIANMENEARRDSQRVLREIRDDTQRRATKESASILALAIQRCAADHTVESTVSVVSLPNDEMKGRIIGREGRNIRAFETATGVDVIIDDTPEAVILSGFDPIRRETARRSLERLITDGRIHPGRIEETVAKVRKEMEETILEAGEVAAMEAGVPGLHTELIRLLGRLKYRTSYGQNVLQHSKEVSYLVGVMASELELDGRLARRVGLLHDVGKAVDHEAEGTHAEIGADLAGKFGEPGAVVEGIRFHHDDATQHPDAFISTLVQAADAVSSARPGARRETLESYIKRLKNLEHVANSFPGVTKSYAIQAGREIRIMVEHKEVSDQRAEELAQAIAKQIEAELEYPGQIKVVVIREVRVVDYAK